MPVNFRGKDYNTVLERLEPAHGAGARPIGIKSVVTEVRPAGQITAIFAAITFDDGRVFTGMSEIKFDATSGADKDAPLECAETSAVGRALQFAGYYGSDDGLAGAEEVRTATQRRENRERAPGVPTRSEISINGDLRSASPRPAPVIHDPWPQDDAPFPGDTDERRPAPNRQNGGPPATPKQLAALAKFGVKPDPGLTVAQASALMSDLIAAKGGAR